METHRWWKNQLFSEIDTENRKKYYTTLSDEALCLLYRTTKDQEIIITLLDRYDRYLVFLAMPFVQVLDSVSDFKSDLYLVLFNLLMTSKPKVFKHWLGRVAKNKIYDRIKKKRPELLEEIPDKQTLVENQWNFCLDFEKVRSAIVELQPDQRIYIELAFWGGYKQREIREMFGWPKDKPRIVRQSAIKNLRKLLEGKGTDFIDFLENI